MILTNEMIKITEAIKEKGFYRITALNTNAERKAINRMVKRGMVKVSAKNATYIDIIKNWK